MNCSQDEGGEHEKKSKFREAHIDGGIVEVDAPNDEKQLYPKACCW
jgi:hypothetical protein